MDMFKGSPLYTVIRAHGEDPSEVQGAIDSGLTYGAQSSVDWVDVNDPDQGYTVEVLDSTGATTLFGPVTLDQNVIAAVNPWDNSIAQRPVQDGDGNAVTFAGFFLVSAVPEFTADRHGT